MGNPRTSLAVGFFGLMACCLSCSQSLVTAPAGSVLVVSEDTPDESGNPHSGAVAAAGDEPAATFPMPPPPPAPWAPAEPDDNDSEREEAVALLQGQDSDDDGRSDFDEVLLGTDPSDPTDGPDVDGDGLLNGEDDDVDGDGISNGEDDDVDGDGVSNSMDDDDDGDGEPDATDDDDDGDGDDDCQCENGTCEEVSGSCQCEDGWEGSHCDQFHCRDIRNCYNGTCVGPNACRCDPGWESVGPFPCASFHCRGVRSCSGPSQGTCVGPNACDCHADWKGSSDCSRPTCVSVFAYCDQGPPCTVGLCETTTGCSYVSLCTSEQACVAGDCVKACNNASGCAPGQSCRGVGPERGCLDGCANDSDCIDGNACTIDTCDPQTGCSHEAFPCDRTQTCQRGRCVEPCEEDDDCGDRRCREGGCTNGCLDDNHCQEGENCTEDGACLPPQEGEEPAP